MFGTQEMFKEPLCGCRGICRSWGTTEKEEEGRGGEEQRDTILDVFHFLPHAKGYSIFSGKYKLNTGFIQSRA